jgi:hypothetical protein
MPTETKTETLLGTKEVAARLKIEPRYLRAMLRKINGKATGERYEWKASDPFLKKLPELIKAEETKKAEAAKDKPAKKS